MVRSENKYNGQVRCSRFLLGGNFSYDWCDVAGDHSDRVRHAFDQCGRQYSEAYPVGQDNKLPDHAALCSTLGGISIFGINGFVLVSEQFCSVFGCTRQYSSSRPPVFPPKRPNSPRAQESSRCILQLEKQYARRDTEIFWKGRKRLL
jgi:hypothetical protein